MCTQKLNKPLKRTPAQYVCYYAGVNYIFTQNHISTVAGYEKDR